MESSEQMRRLGEDAQEAFASGNPDTLSQDGGNMMQVTQCDILCSTIG